MNKKIISSILALIIIFVIVMIPNLTNAYSVSPTSINLTVGGTTTITINASGETGRFDVASSNSNVVAINQSSVWAENNSIAITVTAKSAGSATITITPTDVSNSTNGNPVSGARQVAVTVTAPVQQPSPTPPPTTKPTPAAPTFSNANETVYATTDVNVRSSYSTSSSSLGQLKKGESVTRTGVSSTSVNGYTWSKVTFNGKTGYIASKFLTTTKPETPASASPSVSPTPTTDKSNDATLKSLSITGVQISPEFAANVTSYTANVEEDIAQVEVLAVANNEKATVEITGNENLQNGENTIVVKVTAEDGTVNNYEIKLTKGKVEKPLIAVMGIKENDEKIELVLENPVTTSEGIIEYTINLTEWLKAVEVSGTLTDEVSVYEGIGTLDLIVGENKYTIILKQQIDGTEKTTEYRLTINNPAKVVPATEENKIDYKLIAIIGAGVLFAIIVISAIVVHNKKKNDLDYGETDYSFLRDDEDIQNKERDRKQEFLDNFSNNDNDDDTRRGGKHF